MEVKRKLDWISKIGVGLILICVILLVYMGIVGIVFCRKINMPIKIFMPTDYYNVLDMLERDYENSIPHRSNKQYKALVEEQLDLNFYIYIEKELDNHNGLAIATIRTIVLDDDLTGYQYCYVFTHEAMHFKKFAKNETYICFETFKFLYENEDEELHNVGVWYAIRQLYGYYSGEYDCSDYIINYLK